MLHLSEMPFPLSSNAHHLSLVLSAQCFNYFLSVEGGAYHFGSEGIGSLQKLFLPDLLALVDVGIELGGILHVRPQDCRVWYCCPHFLLAVEVVLLWVLESVVIVLDGGGEDQSFLLRGERATCLAKSAVSSMSLVLEVVEWK